MKADTVEARKKLENYFGTPVQMDSPSGKYWEMKRLVEKDKLTPERLNRLREEYKAVPQIQVQLDTDPGNLQYLFSLVEELEEKDRLIQQLKQELEEKNKLILALQKKN